MFKSKTNIVLLIILVFLVGSGVFLYVKVFGSPTPKMIDFKEMSVVETTAWFKEKNIEDKLVIEYEYDDSIPEGELIFQSTKEDTEIKDKVTLVYSKGKDPNQPVEIPVENLTDYETTKSYFDSNGFVNVEYVYEEGEEEGKILSIEPNKTKKDEKITVKVSKKKVETEKNENTSDTSSINSSNTSNTNSSDKVILPTNLLGITEESFLSKCKELGLTNVVKDEEGYYSTATEKGKLAYYLPDGEISKNTKVVYKLSLGSYEFADSTFNGLTKKEAENLIAELKNKNAKINSELDLVEKDSGSKDVLFGCEGLKNDGEITISCFISSDKQSDNSYVELPTDLLGVSEDDFLNNCKRLGLTNVVKDDTGYYSTLNAKNTIAYYNPDGKLKSDTKVIYKLSLGKYNFNAEDYNGKTKAEVEDFDKKLNDMNAHVSLSFQESSSSDVEKGKAFDCSASVDGINTKVVCKISSGN